MYYVVVVTIVLVSTDFGPSLIFPIPCVRVATVSDLVNSEIEAVVVHAVNVPFVSPFVNLLVYVAIGANICAVPIDLF